MPADSVSYQYLPGYRSQLRTPPKWSCLSQLVHKVGIVFPYRHWHGRQEWKVVIIIHYPLGGGVSYKHSALASTSRRTVPLKVWTEPPFDCYSTLIFQKSVKFPHIRYCTFVLFLFCFNNIFSMYSLYKLCNSNRSKWKKTGVCYGWSDYGCQHPESWCNKQRAGLTKRPRNTSNMAKT